MAKPVDLGKSVGLSKEDRRAAAKAKFDAERAERQQRIAARKLSLPAGVTLVRMDNLVTALHIDGADVRVQVERDGRWLPLPVQAAHRNRFAKRVWVELDDHKQHALYPYEPGEQGMADVGCKDASGGGGFGLSLGNDPISMVIGLVMVLFLLVAFPFWIASRVGKCARAEELLTQLRAALP